MARSGLRPVAVMAIALVAGAAARANDFPVLPIGGLTFVPDSDLTIDSEDLHISPDRVSVRYQLINSSARPLAVTVAFPLPEIVLSEAEDIALPVSSQANFVGSETRIDGAVVQLDVQQRAKAGERDVSALLSQLKLPLLPIGSREIRINDLPDATRKTLVDEGLVMPWGISDKGRPHYVPAWVVQTSANQQLTLPPGKTVTIEHHYTPIVRSGLDTILRASLRNSSGLATDVERMRKDYCIGDAFFARLDKPAGDRLANTAALAERRLRYVVKAKAGASAPIKSFKLTIAPGAPDRLVSFCSGQLRPDAAGALTFSAKNYSPDQDLNILIIGNF